jgi:RNA polymerase subunit RPABC4/transcription elongation factor Spt4
MTQNYYYEYRCWNLFWGLNLDGKREVQRVIKQFNADDWRVVQFEWGATKHTFLSNILIILVQLFTLGFVSHWVGFAIIFEKNTEAKAIPKTSSNTSNQTNKEASSDKHATSLASSKTCSKCAVLVKASDIFCENCGNQLD